MRVERFFVLLICLPILIGFVCASVWSQNKKQY